MSTFSTWTQAEVAQHNARVQGANRIPSGSPDPGPESKLHEDIIAVCKQRGWIYFHGSMAHRTRRTIAEPDFTILADHGRVYFIEAKTKTGKLSREQLGLQQWAAKLHHTIHLVRSKAEFLTIIADDEEHDKAKTIGDELIKMGEKP